MKKALCLLLCTVSVSMCLFAVGCDDEQTTEEDTTSYVFTVPTTEAATVPINVDGLDKLEKNLVYTVAEEVDQWTWNDVKSFVIKDIAGYSEHLGTVYIKYSLNNKKGKPEIAYMYVLIDPDAKAAEIYTPYMDVDEEQFNKVKSGYVNQKKFNIEKINKSLQDHFAKLDLSDE